MIAAAELDELILSFCNKPLAEGRQGLRQAEQVLEHRGIQISDGVADALDARMAVLVQSGRLEAKGNIREWRYSEVRSPAATAEAATARPLEA